MPHLSVCRPPFRELSLLSLLLALCSLAQAAEFHTGQRYSLPAGQTVSQNLYAAAGDVVASGNITGDLVAAGRNILLQGTISQDASLAAENVNIVGPVQGDVRTAGKEILISSPLGGDLIAAGSRVQVLSGTVIDGDVAAVGGESFIAGTLRRSLMAAGGSVTINGEVTGPVQVRAGSLTIGPDAVLRNGLTYWSETEAKIDPSARITGPVVFHQTATGRPLSRMLTSLWILFVIAGFLAVLLTAVVAFGVFRSGSQALVRHTIQAFGHNLLIGFLVFILAPVLLLALVFTLVGIPASVLGTTLYIGFGVVAIIFAGVVFGSIVFGRSAGGVEKPNWKTVVLGVIVLWLISLIPVLGNLVYAVLALAVFGSLFHMAWRRIQKPAV